MKVSNNSAITFEQMAKLMQQNNAELLAQIENSIGRRITAIETKVDGFITNVTSTVDQLESRVTVLEDTASQINISNLTSEINERLYRTKNLIMHGVTDLPEESLENTQLTYLEHVQYILSNVPAINLAGISFHRMRVSRTPGVPLPLLIRFTSPDEVLRVLRNKHALPAGITASADRTKHQREELRAAIAEVEKHNLANPDNKKVVKYVNGEPAAVFAKKQLRKSKK